MAADRDTVDRYIRRANAFAAIVRAVPADAWDNRTPCPDWTARKLLAHVAANAGLFFGLVGAPPPELPPVADDPLATWRASDRAVRAALADPAMADREFDGYLGRTTLGRAIDAFLSFDLVVHGWDLAQATGQRVRIPAADVAQVFDAARGFGDALRSAGVCGPPLEPPRDADDQTRLLAFLGRRA